MKGRKEGDRKDGETKEGGDVIRDGGILKDKMDTTALKTFDSKLNFRLLIRVYLLHRFSCIRLSALPPCCWKPRNSITGQNYISLNELD